MNPLSALVGRHIEVGARDAVKSGPIPGLLRLGAKGYGAVSGMHPLDRGALATAPVPVLGDAVGLAADARMFAQEPESRNPLNFGLAALGALPFVPALSTARRGVVKAGDIVDGLTVGKDVPNTNSISASLTDYEEVPGVQALSMEVIPSRSAKDLFYASNDHKRVSALADEIRQSGRIDPLIVVEDKEGYYILEGAHRIAALDALGKKEFPAVVIRDLESLVE